MGLLVSSAIVVRIRLAICPHSPSALFESKATVPLAKSIDPLRGKDKVHLEIIVRQKECLILGRNENLVSVAATNLETKGVLLKLKITHRKPHLVI